MAAHPSFGSACERGNIVTLVRQDGLKLPLHKELVDLVAILLDLTEMNGLDVRPGETWGYACRKISGSNKMSNHSWGTAVDINAPANPYASAAWHQENGNTTIRGKRLKTEFSEAIVKMWEERGFRWGGMYTSKPDPMHFEFMGSVEDARRYTRELRDFFAGSGKPAPPPPAPKPQPQPQPKRAPAEKTVWKEGDTGQKIRDIQTVCRNAGHYTGKIDGIWGPKTTAAVKLLQRDVKVSPDGIWGPKTQEAVDRAIAYAAAAKKQQRPELKRGSKGDQVRYCQNRLNAHGFGIKVDGDFGPNTESAVKRFQKGKGLRADGIVGPKTWAKLG